MIIQGKNIKLTIEKLDRETTNCIHECFIVVNGELFEADYFHPGDDSDVGHFETEREVYSIDEVTSAYVLNVV